MRRTHDEHSYGRARPRLGRASADEITLNTAQPGPITEVPAEQVLRRRAEHLIRRLNLVLFDLRLDRTVPTGWVVPTDQGLAFGLLSLKQADELIRALENLVSGRSPAPSGPGPGQLSFFKAGS